ncbi:MAG: efflux RND transporter periplasmic adaptor subunit [Burkholderiales bacterium]|nr:efflux RND transporter periplasmic adaptor subunit [Burkholderiales bacterium]
MKEYLTKIKLYIFSHKKISILTLIILLVLGYWIYGKIINTDGETQYTMTTVQKGTIISSVSASGQIESSNQIDLKANVSDTITYVAVKAGDKVKRGAVLFSVDNKDAQKSVRDAQISLESAKISLNKLKAQLSEENMNADLAKAYDDGFNNVSNVFLDLPEIMTGLNSMFFKSTISPSSGQWNIDWYEGKVATEDRDKVGEYKADLTNSYNKVLLVYDKNYENYKLISRTSDKKDIEALILETYETVKLISDVTKKANNYLDFINDSMQENDFDIPSIISTHKNTLSTYTSKTNNHLLNLLSIKTSIKDYKDAFYNSDLDIQSSELSLKQKENSLQDAKDKLSDYYVTAPFDGTIASVIGKIGDTASGSLGSIITNQKIATLSMNEVDVAKIKLGQKATITFDAIEDLSMTGTIAEIDTVGTVSQGVVSYSVKIAFDTNDEQIKPGMSVSASIITDSKTDVLYIPSSAIKTNSDTKYVLMFSTQSETPNQITIETGISDDINTEIISGLKEGDQIVLKTTISSSATKTTQGSSLLGGTNIKGVGGGVNFPR